MFTLPPRPPKDYFLTDVTKSLQSSSQFSPSSLPRITQRNIGKYCFPIEYKDEEVPEKRPPDPVEPIIKEKMTHDAKAFWVVGPGKDDFFVHDTYRRYSKLEDRKSYDPRYHHKERIFNRPYIYELDCTEVARLDKLRDKCEREEGEFEDSYEKLVHEQQEREKPTIVIQSCKEGPPGWWKADKDEMDKVEKGLEILLKKDTPRFVPVERVESCLRWQEEPNLAGLVQDDPCRRKYDMNMLQVPGPGVLDGVGIFDVTLRSFHTKTPEYHSRILYSTLSNHVGII